MTISIQIDDKQVQRMLKHLASKPRLNRAITMATNDGLKAAKVELNSATREQVTLAVKKVNEKILIRKAYQGKGGHLRIKARGLQLNNYKSSLYGQKSYNDPRYEDTHSTERPAGGISVKTHKKSARTKYGGAFYVKLPNGSYAIAKRKRGHKKKFKVLHGPSVYQVLKNKTADQTMPIIQRRYVRAMSRQYDRILSEL